uniref:Uncharacterized protein n=1 Tax=Phlebotomus papatasi TaxID=29031 RepID=A0A1B0DJS7_PHLPP
MESEKDGENPEVEKICFLRRFLDKYQVLIISILTLVFLSGPHHLYGIVMDCERFQSISPPVFFIAIQMIMQPCLVESEDNIGQNHLRKILTSSILMHTLPLVLLISQPHLNQPVHNLVRYHSVKLNDLEMPTNSMKRWGNISGINNNFEEEDQPMKNMTSQGVEILDTIPEEDEGVSGKSVEIQEIKPKEYLEDLPGRKWLFFLEYWQEILKIFTQLFINPFRYIVERQTLVPGVILKACDVFIYILMVSGLPCYASGSTFNLNFFDTGIFLTLMATPILVVTFSSAWMDDVLREEAKYWHIAGEICKLIGCIVTTCAQTLFFLRMGVLFLGIGQGVFSVVQDRVLREITQENDWRKTKCHTSAVCGYLVLIFTFFTNNLLLHFTLRTIFLTSAVFYSAAILIFTLTIYF